jgi:hypothetical protein
MKPKIIAMYLPQFHQIPENDEFWGEGFTDWVTVKKAKPLFKGHQQPKVPLKNNYYDLSIKENVAWQAKLAKEYGIYGFGIYHYWFNNEKNLLTKPAEIILENKCIDINFFFAWDNISWKRSWSNLSGNDWAPLMDTGGKKLKEKPILIPYILGSEEDWERHYNSLIPYFKDERYIKKDNRPIFIIFHYCEKIGAMCQYWDSLAKKDGFNGMCFIFRYSTQNSVPQNEKVFKYEPQFSGWSDTLSLQERVMSKLERILGLKTGPKFYKYQKIWNEIIKNAEEMNQPNIYHGAFVSYDDTPRRGFRGKIVSEATPSNFEFYMKRLYEISKSQNKDFIFLTAWNEWGEGACLEPDEINAYKYLEVIKKVIER